MEIQTAPRNSVQWTQNQIIFNADHLTRTHVGLFIFTYDR